MEHLVRHTAAEVDKVSWVETGLEWLRENDFRQLRYTIEGVRDSEIRRFNRKELGFYYFLKARLLYNTNRRPESTVCMQDALQKFRSTKNISWYCFALTRYATDFAERGEWDEAERRYVESYELAANEEDSRYLRPIIDSDYATSMFRANTDIPRALSLLVRSYEVALSSSPFNAMGVMTNAAIVAQGFVESKTSLKYIRSAVELAEGAEIIDEQPYLPTMVLGSNGYESRMMNISHRSCLAYLNYASQLSGLGNYTQALKYLQLSFDLAHRNNYHDIMSVVSSRLGVLSSHQDDYAAALHHAEAALHWLGDHGDQSRMTPRLLLNIGEAAAKLGMVHKAEESFQKALRLCTQLGQPADATAVRIEIADYYITYDRYAEAADLLRETLLEAQRDGNQAFIARSYHLLGVCYTHLKSEMAAETLMKGLIVAQQFDNTNEECAIHKALATHYKLMGNTTGALIHFEQYCTLNTQLSTERVRTLRSNLEILHDVDKLKSDNELTDRRNAQLQSEVSAKSNELRRLAQNINDRQEMVSAVERSLHEALRLAPKNIPDKLKDILKNIRSTVKSDEVMKDFSVLFEEVYTKEIEIIRAAAPQLSKSDVKICILIAQSKNSKQIAEDLYMSYRTVDNARVRIRKVLRVSSAARLELKLKDLLKDLPARQ